MPFLVFALLAAGTLLFASPQQTAEADIFYRGPDIISPKLIHKVEPAYSEAARKTAIQGNVLIEVVIDERGIPDDFGIVSPLGYGLDQEAIQCVSQWRFSPATKNDKPVKFRAMIQVSFRLAELPFDWKTEDQRTQSNLVAALLRRQNRGRLSEYSVNVMQDLAGRRVAAAEYVVGLWRLQGDVLPKNEGAGIAHIRMAAKDGSAPALLYLGNAQMEGRLIPRNTKAGLACLRKAASLGNVDAQFNLGKRYMDGDEVDVDTKLSRKYLESCARAGKSECQARLDLLSTKGPNSR